jgi:hypothetical protein
MSDATCGACRFWAGRCRKSALALLNKIALDLACEKYGPRGGGLVW